MILHKAARSHLYRTYSTIHTFHKQYKIQIHAGLCYVVPLLTFRLLLHERRVPLGKVLVGHECVRGNHDGGGVIIVFALLVAVTLGLLWIEVKGENS